MIQTAMFGIDQFTKLPETKCGPAKVSVVAICFSSSVPSLGMMQVL
jgi:hypothetical protein